MSEYCVVVAGGSRARIFTLEPAELPELQSGPNLVERKSLSNPERQAREDAIFSDLRRGRNRAATGPGHTYDEHRLQHDREVGRKFARDIAQEVGRMVSRNGFQHVVLCAEKRMLGLLRPSLNDNLGQSIDYQEIPKDLAKLPSRELHDRLAEAGHLPRRRARRA